ncbi:MAG: tetratricopeptide repeat protein, partial [Ginsengibacter sp.]
FMSNLSRGKSREMYAERAQKSAMTKTEGEKLFASLADSTKTQDQRRDIWAKLHSMFPDGEMLAHYYAVTRATPEERFAAAEDFIKQFPNSPGMYNTIAYYYMQNKKDNEMAKKNFEKYIELYPEGTNPYDSMGEYYLTTGDKENSKKYYGMALEKYPFYDGSITALQKMADQEKSTDSK